MKIAFLHFDFCGGPQSANTKKILHGMKIAAAYGAEWILTPEMALQGYFMVKTEEKYILASSTNGIYEPFKKAATDLDIRLFLGCGEQETGAAPHNSCVVIDQNGQLTAKHDKVKVVKWITENWAEPGKGFKVHHFDGVQTGLLICADTWFEEHGELLGKQGAELIVSIASWPDSNHGGHPQEAWRRCSKSAGGIPLLLSNQTGDYLMDCSKAESAVAQDGEIVCTYSGEEAILLVDFDKRSKRVLSNKFEIVGLS